MTARRSSIIVLAVVVVLVASSCQNWTSARGDEHNTAFDTSEAVLGLDDAGSVGQVFTADLGVVLDGWQTPVVWGNRIYAPMANTFGAFDFNGTTGCGESPMVCRPLWQGDIGDGSVATAVTVTDAAVYATAGRPGSDSKTLFAFDVNGEVGCSGTPRWCQPLWTANGVSWAPPTIVGTTLYVTTADGRLAAFDARGTTGCAGTPTVCGPLWKAADDGEANSSPVAVAGGMVFVTTFDGRVRAYDAAGIVGCSGSPTVCQPRWVGNTGGEPNTWPTAPVVSGGRVYVAMDQGRWDTPPQGPRALVTGFALDGGDRCDDGAGHPPTCDPEWSATVDGSTASLEIAAAYGSIYIETVRGAWPASTAQLAAIDQDEPSCMPGPCAPTWTASLASPAGLASPIVANGVVYASMAGSIAAIDAHGVIGCDGQPKVCSPSTFATYPDLHSTGWAIAEGKLVLISNDGARYPGVPRHTLRVIG